MNEQMNERTNEQTNEQNERMNKVTTSLLELLIAAKIDLPLAVLPLNPAPNPGQEDDSLSSTPGLTGIRPWRGQSSQVLSTLK